MKQVFNKWHPDLVVSFDGCISRHIVNTQKNVERQNIKYSKFNEIVCGKIFWKLNFHVNIVFT